MSDKIKIFVVDDSKIGQVMLSKMLSDASDDIEIIAETTTAFGALFMLEDIKPDIIMLKLNIPGDMESHDALRQIREKCPNIYIVLCPMPQDRSDLDDFIREGKADNFLPKPIKQITLERLLARYVEYRNRGKE
ncbi:MAG: response regulator [Defluviitaleaceae bacterium]|nr:response regulator [Defluviitaleaceae bacterium]